jgi:hypothetical protein
MMFMVQFFAKKVHKAIFAVLFLKCKLWTGK